MPIDDGECGIDIGAIKYLHIYTDLHGTWRMLCAVFYMEIGPAFLCVLLDVY